MAGATHSTVADMGRIHPRHLDQRRLLEPRDYVEQPESFGLSEQLKFRVPVGGDEISMRIVATQHLLVCLWNRTQRHVSAVQLEQRFGVKKQTMSLTTKGRRWAGRPLAAVVFANRITMANRYENSRLDDVAEVAPAHLHAEMTVDDFVAVVLARWRLSTLEPIRR